MSLTETTNEGSYYVKGQEVIHRPLISAHEATQSAELFQRLDWQEVQPTPKLEPTEVLEISNLHPDEAISALLTKTHFLGQYARVQISDPNQLAARTGIGSRGGIFPTTPEAIATWPLEKVHQLVVVINGQGIDQLISSDLNESEKEQAEALTGLFEGHPDYEQVMKVQQSLQRLANWQTQLSRSAEQPQSFLQRADQALQKIELRWEFSRLKSDLKNLAQGAQYSYQGSRYWLGVKDDLNRDLPIPASAQSVKEVLAQLPTVEAQTLVQFLADRPDMKIMVSVHQDRELGKIDPLYEQETLREGVYFYVCEAQAVHRDLIYQLRDNFNLALAERGFATLTGPDDLNDPAMGNWIDQGLQYVTLTDKKDEQTFEWAAVKLNTMGIGGIHLSVCLEVPYHLSEERKVELLGLFETIVIKPLLAAVNIMPVQTKTQETVKEVEAHSKISALSSSK